MNQYRITFIGYRGYPITCIVWAGNETEARAVFVADYGEHIISTIHEVTK